MGNKQKKGDWDDFNANEAMVNKAGHLLTETLEINKIPVNIAALACLRMWCVLAASIGISREQIKSCWPSVLSLFEEAQRLKEEGQNEQ